MIPGAGASPQQPSFERQFRKILKLTYGAAFLLMLAAAATLVFWEQREIAHQEGGTALINQLGLQRAAAQRAALQLIRFSQHTGPDKEPLRRECASGIQDLQGRHRILNEGDRALGIPAPTNPALKQLLQELDGKFNRFVKRLDALSNPKPGAELLPQDFDSLYLLSGELSAQLDKITDQLTREAIATSSRHRLGNWIFLGAYFLVAAAAVLFVFRPMMHRLFSEVTSLDQSQQRLASAQAAAAETVATQSLFVAHVAERMRTALTEVIDRATTMEKDLLDYHQGQYADFAEAIRQRSTQMLAAANDMLNLACIESGQTPMMPRAVNLSHLLHDMTPYLQPLAENKGLVFNLSLPEQEVWVTGDPDQIWRMIEKIFNNSVKFTEHGEISITLSAMAESRVTIAIRDTGRGIAPEMLPFIFDPVPVEEGETSAEEGLGINLSVAKRLAAHMHSSINAHSEIDKGTTFLIDMPGCAPSGGAPAR